MIEIIVAYYNSLAFTEILPLFYENTSTSTIVKIYDKSENQENNFQELQYPKIERIPRENRGREGETYLSHMIDNYDSLAEYNLFIQDDTDNHITNIYHFIKNTQFVVRDKHPFFSYPCSWKKGGNPYRRTILHGQSDLHTFPSPDAILQASIRFRLPLPIQYETDICAFFIVSREKIRTKPVAFYRELREWLLSDDANGFVLEHIWQLIFS